MKSKRCPQCKLTKSTSLFHINRTKVDGLHHRCKDCQNKYTREHYKKNKQTYLDKAARNNAAYKKEAYRFLVEYCKLHPCKCGEKDFVVLEFNHKDREKKSYTVSWMMCKGMSVGAIKREIKKCEVLCANCHRRHTAKQMNWYKFVEGP
jgi:hypothetical protein